MISFKENEEPQEAVEEEYDYTNEEPLEEAEMEYEESEDTYCD